MKDIVIIGAGGVGREVSLIIEQINSLKPTWNILGFIDDNPNNLGKIIDGQKVIGDSKYLMTLSEETYVVIAIANYKVKKTFVEKLGGCFKFATIIHPRVLVHDFMTVGEGTIIYEGVILTTDIRIGSQVIISPKCGIGHDSIIKDYVSLLWNVNVSGADVIGEGVLVGSGATIIQNLKIGQGATIGAGAVVLNSIPENCTAVGVPAKVLEGKDLFEKDIVCNHG